MLKKMNQNYSVAIVTAISVLTLFSCGKSETATTTSGAAADASLSSLPSASSMTATNESALLDRDRSPIRGLSKTMMNRSYSPHAVVGTPPLMTELKALADGDAGTYDNSVFYGSLLKTINDDYQSGGITSGDKMTYANQFYGGNAGGPGGQGACFMAQSVGEAIGRLQQAGTSRCYMQGMSETVSSGITVTGSIPQAQLFAQATADKTVKVTVTGMGGGGGGDDMDVFIKVSGSDSIGSDAYRATLHFCSGSTVTGYEVIDINKASGLVSMTSADQRTEGGSTSYGSSTVTAYIKKSGSDYVWDTSKDRTANTHYSGAWGKFKSNLQITSDNYIYNRMYNDSTFGSSKVYSVSEFSGTGLKSLRFLQAGFNGLFTCTSCGGGGSTNTFAGGTEFQTSYYVNADNAFKTEAATVNLSTDTFFSTLGNPTIDLSAYSCSVTPDATVSMNFAVADVAAIQTSCEADRFSDYDMCNQSAIQTIEGYIH